MVEWRGNGDLDRTGRRHRHDAKEMKSVLSSDDSGAAHLSRRCPGRLTSTVEGCQRTGLLWQRQAEVNALWRPGPWPGTWVQMGAKGKSHPVCGWRPFGGLYIVPGHNRGTPCFHLQKRGHFQFERHIPTQTKVQTCCQNL